MRIKIAYIMSFYFKHYRGLSGDCWWRIFFAFLESFAAGILFFLPIYFVHALHFNVAASGLVITAYGVGTTTGGIMGGYLSDRISPGMISTNGLMIMGFAFLLLPELHTVRWLIGCLFVIGLAAYLFVTANTIWILNECHHHAIIKQRALSIIFATSNLGIGLAAIVVILVMRHYGFKWLFHLFATLLLAGTIIIIYIEFLIPEKTSHIMPRHPVQDHKQPMISKALLWLILIIVFLTGIVISQQWSTYPIFIHDHYPNWKITGVGLLFALNSLLVVFCQTPLINALHKYNKLLLVGSGTLLMGIGMLMLNFAPFYALAILACIVYTIGEMLFFPTAQLLCYQGKKRPKGFHLGLFRSVYAFSVIAGPTLGGILYHYNGTALLWYLCGVIGLLGFILSLMFFRLI